MIVGREASSYEKGLLTGVGIGAVVGPSITLVVFLLIICYDLGRPQIIEIGQRAMSRILNIEDSQREPNKMYVTPSGLSTSSGLSMSPNAGGRQDEYHSLSSTATKIGLNLLSGVQNVT